MTDQHATAPPLDTIVINIEINRDTLRDLLCTAAEGGSNYWARFTLAAGDRTANLDYLRVKVTELESHSKDVPRVNRYITAEDLAHGLEKLARAAIRGTTVTGNTFPAAGKHLADALSEDGDAATADVVLQMTVFGEVIYG